MNTSLTSALVHYWTAHLPGPVDRRRSALEAVCARVRAGETPPDALLPFALGDTDTEIVDRASAEYLAKIRGDRGLRSDAIDAVVDWVRRRLALNRGAVVAALLRLDESPVLDQLLPLRLTLDAEEFEIVERSVGARAAPGSRDFLAEWRVLRAARPD